MQILFILFSVILVAACSNKQVYNAVQANQRSQCADLPPSEYQECKERENLSYEQYQEERKKL